MIDDPLWPPAVQLPPVQPPPVQSPPAHLRPMHLAPVYLPPGQSPPACLTRRPMSIHLPPAHPPPARPRPLHEPQARLAAGAAPVSRHQSRSPAMDQGSRIASPIPCSAPETMYIRIERVPMWMSPVSVMPGIRRKLSGTLRRSTLVSAMRAL